MDYLRDPDGYDYFRFDTTTTTNWTEDPGFVYFLDVGDFRHFHSAPATTFVPVP